MQGDLADSGIVVAAIAVVDGHRSSPSHCLRQEGARVRRWQRDSDHGCPLVPEIPEPDTLVCRQPINGLYARTQASLSPDAHPPPPDESASTRFRSPTSFTPFSVSLRWFFLFRIPLPPSLTSFPPSSFSPRIPLCSRIPRFSIRPR